MTASGFCQENQIRILEGQDEREMEGIQRANFTRMPNSQQGENKKVGRFNNEVAFFSVWGPFLGQLWLIVFLAEEYLAAMLTAWCSPLKHEGYCLFALSGSHAAFTHGLKLSEQERLSSLTDRLSREVAPFR